MLSSEDLRFFCTLASNVSLAATARMLNVTPPSVTQRLQLIEEKLHLKLVNRQGRATSLTDEGQLLLEHGRLILDEMEQLHESLQDRKNDVVGRLKIRAPLGFGNEYVAPLAAKFQRQHKNLSVELELSDSPNRARGQAWDILIHIGELPDSSLVKSHILKNRRFLCASPAYLAQHGNPASMADLRHHACIALRENAEDVTLWKMRAFGGDKFESTRITPKLACNDGRVVKQWALAGYGIMIRSEWDVARDLMNGTLVRVLPAYELPDADIVALLDSERHSRSARTMRFLDYLKAELALMPWYAA